MPHVPAPVRVAEHSGESLPPLDPRHTHRCVSPAAGKNVNEASPVAHCVSAPYHVVDSGYDFAFAVPQTPFTFVTQRVPSHTCPPVQFG